MMDRYATYGTGGSNPWIKRGIAAAVLLGFAGLLVFATLDHPSSDENVNPPLVTAPQGSIKERPENPGGMEVPNRDKEVFDLLDVNGGATVPTPNQAQVDAAQVPAQASATGSAVVAATQPQPAAQAPVQQPAPVAANPVPAAKPVAAAPAPKPAAAAPAPVKKAEPAPAAKAVTASGNWAVQLGSFRKKEDADKAAKTYTSKFSSLLKGLDDVVKSADLGDKGTVYRVYFKGLSSQDAARTLCNKFKAQNQGCLTAQL
jgi:cell division protein FtsN